MMKPWMMAKGTMMKERCQKVFSRLHSRHRLGFNLVSDTASRLTLVEMEDEAGISVMALLVHLVLLFRDINLRKKLKAMTSRRRWSGASLSGPTSLPLWVVMPPG